MPQINYTTASLGAMFVHQGTEQKKNDSTVYRLQSWFYGSSRALCSSPSSDG